MNPPYYLSRILCSILLLGLWSCSSLAQDKQAAVFKVAFGSCGNQNHPLPIFDEIVKHRPDVFIFLGDNIYGDTRDMDVLRGKYKQLGDKPTYQNLKKNTEILAVWDDHDYGENDAGKHYPLKEESRRIFLEFFEEPDDSERYEHEGIYHSVYREAGDKTIQIILLDGRTFRDNLLRMKSQEGKDPRYFYKLDYAPHTNQTATLLGEQQWVWLEEELKKPADFRILASGTQFGIEYNGYEAWANFPHEQERLVKLIQKTRANHLVVISGDVHYAEISKFEPQSGYPLYDITASGLSQRWLFATPNKNRIEGPVMDNHFGLLTLKLAGNDPVAVAEIWDIRGNQRIEYQIPLKEINF